ncbi:MAG: hypothetical protein WD768_05045 [Phycisphaeraceae bacterium]
MRMRKVRNAWRTFSGLMTFSDVLGTIGFWLYRGTMRRTMLFVVGLTAIYIADQKSDMFQFGLTMKKAVGSAGLVFLFCFVGGALLMFLGGSFSKAALTSGEAKGSNLLEDMKKARQPIHRERLWENVIRHERDLHGEGEIEAEAALIEQNHHDLITPWRPGAGRVITQDHCLDLTHVIGTLGLTRTGWDIAFDHAMMLPLPRSLLKHHMRFDLSKLKDWYDGAPFHHTDTKLQQQFDAVESLQEAKKDSRVTRFFLFTHTRKRLLQTMWFKVITRAIQLRVSRACGKLDKKYAPFHFSIDQFLWPNKLSDDMIRGRLGDEALSDLIDMRQHIFKRVMSPEPQLAARLMYRAIYPNFEAASQLRRLYDPQYVLGEVGMAWRDDLRRYNRAFTKHERQVSRRRAFIQRTQDEQDALMQYLEMHPEHKGIDDPATLRALRVAVHLDFGGLKTLLKVVDKRSWGLRVVDFFVGRSPIRPRLVVGEVIEQVIKERKDYTRKLLAVRVHHELCRSELEDYEFYLGKILGSRVRAKGAQGEAEVSSEDPPADETAQATHVEETSQVGG